ncbi:MAG: DUF2029 domain-containing protein [Saprospiraceae bacterium]|nr:DUF2029 domain-containing protein [Saprospiraceae bacterium]
MAFFILVSVVLSYLSAKDGGDFDVYIEAAYKLYHGMNPYLPPYAKDGMGYSYSPFFIILLIPFTGNYFITEFMWCLLSCFLLYRSFKLFYQYLISEGLTPKEYKIWAWILLILSYQFASNNIGMVQMTIFLLWAILESLKLTKNGQEVLGGLLLGAIINIKIMPVVMLGYLFYRGYLKAFFVAIATAILLLFSPTIFWGFDYNLILLTDWWKIINPTNAEHLMETGIGTHSMVAFLPVFLTETVGELPYNRNIFNLDLDTAIRITHMAILGLISVSLLYFRSWPFTKEKDDIKSIWEISYFMLLIPLIIPHQQKYAFLLVIPMVAYVLFFFIKTYSAKHTLVYKSVLVIFGVSMIVFSPIHGSDIIGWNAFKWSQHYRLITIVTLLLIPISLYCSPKRLRKLIQSIS